MRRTLRDLEDGEHVPGQLPLDDGGPRILSLFSGYGGLDMAVAGLLGGDVIAHAEVDPAACRVLAHRWPHVPNLGDVTAVDWQTLGRVDVITGGFPCQDVSLAGRRLGIRHDTRSGLWGHMAAAVDELRPALVVIENVRGLLSARAHHPAHDPAHSDVEPCPWCMGRPDDVSLRALGAVLGDLADLGYDAAWRTCAAADVGAPHRRERVFVVAWPADADRPGLERNRPGGHTRAGLPAAVGAAGAARDAAGQHGQGAWPVGADGGPVPGRVADRRAAENADVAARDERRLAAPEQAAGGRARADARGRGRAPAADPAHDEQQERADDAVRGAAAGGWALGTAGARGDGGDARGSAAGAPATRRPAAGVDAGARRNAAADADGRRHGQGADAGRVGRVDVGDESAARQRQRARPVPRGGSGEDRRPAAADDAGDGRHEGRTEPARQLGGPHAPERGAARPAAADPADGGRDGRAHDPLGGPLGGAAAAGGGAGARRDDAAWGPYAAAVGRWATVLGRDAPPPTEPNERSGAHRLSPRFTEWMMGLPAGWITDVPGIGRNDALKLCGNGVVPQQAAHAVASLLAAVHAAHDAAPPPEVGEGAA